MSAVSSSQSNVETTQELQHFFPEHEDVPNELAVKVLEKLDTTTLAKIQIVSRTWCIVIETFFHDLIQNIKLHKIFDDFQKIFQLYPVDNEKLCKLLAITPPEILSKIPLVSLSVKDGKSLHQLLLEADIQKITYSTE